MSSDIAYGKSHSSELSELVVYRSAQSNVSILFVRMLLKNAPSGLYTALIVSEA